MRILIENDAAGPDALRVTADALNAAVARRPGLAERLTIRINDDPGGPEAALAAFDPDVLFACHAVDLRRAATLAPSLSWVQVTSAGVEKYLATLPPGMTLTNASGVHAEKGAEFVLAAALMLVFDIPRFTTAKVQRAWSPVFGGPLAGRRVTMLGVGAIGAAAARLLKGFGVRLVGLTRSGATIPEVDRVIGLDEIDAVLGETDILVSTLPLTPATNDLIDRRRIGLLPENAGIVVVGRAKVLDYAAMMDRLEAGTLRGAVLDVYPVEPVPDDDRLWRCPRLVMTPHCSVDDHGAYTARCIDVFVDNLDRRFGGRPLVNVVDPALGY